jgi:hypothetical protein
MNNSIALGGKRVILSLLAAFCLVVGSPVVTAFAGSGGAQKPVSKSHGDCKNDNAGKHKGYVCPTQSPTGGNEGSETGGDTGSGDTGGDTGEIVIIS